MAKKDRTERAELTVLVLVSDEDGRMLLQDRLDPDWGGICFPGGHVEPGESFVRAAAREVREETGLNVDKLTLCGVKQFPISGGRYIVFLFRGSRFSGELHSSPEGPVFWASRDELEGKRLCDNFTQMLSVFTDPDKSEMLWSTEDGEWKLEIL